MRGVGRFLLTLATVFAVVLAATQLTGRIAMSFLDSQQSRLNDLLAASDIELTELAGGWRGLNPVARAGVVRFPGGSAIAVEAEIDLLESLFRGVPVARRLRADAVEVTLVRDSSGRFFIPGLELGDAGAFDWRSALRHSDDLLIPATLIVTSAGEEVTRASIIARAYNRFGQHRAALSVAPTPATPQIGGASVDGLLVAQLEEQRSLAALLGLAEPVRHLRLRGAEVSIDDRLSALYDLSGVRLTRLVGYWSNSGGWAGSGPRADGASQVSSSVDDDEPLGGGVFELDVDEMRYGGDLVPAARARLLARQQAGGVVDFAATELDLFGVALPSWRGQWRSDSGQIIATTETLELGPLLAGLAESFSGAERLSRWLRELGLSGRVQDVQVGWRDGLRFRLQTDGASSRGYRGVPLVAGASATITGTTRSIHVALDGQDAAIAFPELFSVEWPLKRLSGDLRFHFEPGYMGIRGDNVEAETEFGTIWGNLSIARPSDDPYEEGVALLLHTGHVPYAATKDFLSHRLDEGVRQWLLSNVQAGDAERVAIGFQGRFNPRDRRVDSRLELGADLIGATVTYHPDWPVLVDARARLEQTGAGTRVNTPGVESDYGRIGRASLFIPRGDPRAMIDADATMDAQALLRFVRDTPLADWLPVVDETWRGRGPVDVSTALVVPLDDSGEVEAELFLRPRNADLYLDGFRLAFTELDGAVRYQHPFRLTAQGLTASLFGQPARVSARSEPGAIQLQVDGLVSPADVYRVLDIAEMGFGEGYSAFTGVLSVPVERPGEPVSLALRSQLDGTALTLPEPLGKDSAVPRSLRAEIVFASDGERVELNLGEGLLGGWLKRGDSGWIGALGVNAQPDAHGVDSVAVNGVVERVTVEEWLAIGGAGAGEAGIDWSVHGLLAKELAVGDLVFADAVIDSRSDAEGRVFAIGSETLAADIRVPDTGPLNIVVSHLRLVSEPEADGEASDPLTPETLSGLPDADVQLASVWLDDVDLGRWSFELRNTDDGVSFGPLDASYNGLAIVAEEVAWIRSTHRTEVRGEVSGGNLAQILPRFDYAPSVESEAVELDVDLGWPGSPLNFDLARLTGSLDAVVTTGRFVEVDNGQGAMRIFSLLNFSNVAKRMAFDFSDVFGRGVRFNTLSAPATLDDGLLRFDDEMVVDGTGSLFRVAGQVDLGSGKMDAEMIVTLPVSSSLPWYGIYLAAANPLAAAGVLIGQQILRRPLEQVSSAKYRLGGTLDEPVVEFESLFNRSMSERESASDSEAVVASGAAAATADASIIEKIAEYAVEENVDAADERARYDEPPITDAGLNRQENDGDGRPR